MTSELPSLRVPFDDVVRERLLTVARIFGVAAALLGVAVAAGSLLAIAALRDPLVGSMKVNSAIGFVLAGVALTFLAGKRRPWPRVVALLGGAIMVIAIATIAEHAFGFDLGIDQRLAADLVQSSGARGRMAPLVALAFVLIGSGLVLTGFPALSRWSPGLGLAGAALALLPVAGYVFDAPALYEVGSETAIAAHTAVALMLVSVGLLFAGPERGPLAALLASGTAGATARYLIPGAVLVPLAVGGAIRHVAHLEPSIEISVFALASSVILAAITWWAMIVAVRAEHERAAYQERILRSQRRLATTLSSLGDAVITTDAAAEITGLNPAAERLLGTSEADARGRPFRDVVRVVDRAADEAEPVDLATLALRAGRRLAAPDHYQLASADGQHPITYTTAPIVDASSAVEGAVVVIHDAAERVQTQAALSASSRLAALGTLSAGIAHEINNPLTVVVLNLELLRRHLQGARRSSGPSTEPPQLLAQIKDGLDRITAIVRDVKTFARGDVRRPWHAVDVHAIIESALRFVAGQVRERARLTVELSAVPPVLAGEAQLGQVLLNLLGNAIQSIPEGASDHHEIGVGTAVVDGGQVAIWVRDTGVGMSSALLAQLFTPFFTTKGVGAGMGLGLAISRGLIESMGGTIEVESEEGRGSTFRLILRAVPPATTASSPAGSPAPSGPRRRLRVLVVDDEWALARALEVSLRPHHDAVAVRSGVDALASLGDDAPFDFVVCDVTMPGMSGWELYRRACATWPRLATRFVFMTGRTVASDPTATPPGVTGPCLVKPFAVVDLEMMLDALSIAQETFDRAPDPAEPPG